MGHTHTHTHMKLLITLAVFCLLGNTFAATLSAAVGTVQAANDCTEVAKASIANCATTAESSGATQKCCLLTFSAAPTYGGTAVIDAAKGSDVANKKFCYKKGTGFQALEKTGSTKAVTVAGDQFCKTTSAVTTVADYVASGAGGATTTTSSAVVATATACTCTISSTIFTIGFSLLAILASLWK